MWGDAWSTRLSHLGGLVSHHSKNIQEQMEQGFLLFSSPKIKAGEPGNPKGKK